MTRVEDVDARLIATCEAYADAIDRLDGEAADVLMREMDDLLDLRIHLPVQRDAD